MNQKAFASIKIIIIASTVAVLSILVYLYINSGEKNLDDNTAEQIETAIQLAALKYSIPVEGTDIVQQNDSYARVKIETGVEGKDYTAFLIKINDSWQAAAFVPPDQKISCEKAEKIGLPNNFVADCELQFPKAVTAKEFIDKIEINPDIVPSQIIGTFGSGESSCENCFEITSGNQTVVIEFSGSVDSNISEGETVVVQVLDVNNNLGNTTVNSNQITVIDDEPEGESNNLNLDLNFSNYSGGSNSNSGQSSGYKDRDYSGRIIQLIGN